MPRIIYPKLSDEQRAVIVENDPVASDKLRSLWQQVKDGLITPGRARRLQSNIEGIAIDKWRRQCSQLGEPLSSHSEAVSLKRLNSQSYHPSSVQST